MDFLIFSARYIVVVLHGRHESLFDKLSASLLFQLFLLEEQRDIKFNHFARVIQKAFKKYFCKQQLLKQKEEASGKLLFSVKSITISQIFGVMQGPQQLNSWVFLRLFLFHGHS